MSAIGSYAVLRREALSECVIKARNIRTETTGKWIFKRSRQVGHEEFRQAWREALVRQADFEHSGYVLGNYLDVQQAINEIQLIDERSESAQALAMAFTAAYPFDAPVSLPELPADELLAFCREEYGVDAQSMVEALTAAHRFYRRGLDEITPEQVVVFIIQ
jgi:hypothetical protein